MSNLKMLKYIPNEVSFQLEIAISIVPPMIIIPAAVVRTVPSYRLSLPVTGSSVIYTAIINNSTVLINTTDTASVLVYNEGNYTCVATSRYGSEVREFSVIFRGKYRSRLFCPKLSNNVHLIRGLERENLDVCLHGN